MGHSVYALSGGGGGGERVKAVFDVLCNGSGHIIATVMNIVTVIGGGGGRGVKAILDVILDVLRLWEWAYNCYCLH